MSNDVHLHVHPGQDNREVLDRLDHILARVEKLMATVDDMKQDLVEANEVTNEIAKDLEELIAKQVQPGITEADAQDVRSQIQALTAKLRGVASQYTSEGGATQAPSARK